MEYREQQKINGKKGGKMTLKLHGVSHFVKAGKKSVKTMKKRSKKK